MKNDKIIGSKNLLINSRRNSCKMPLEAGQFSFNTKVKLDSRTRGSAAKIQKVIVFLLILLEHPEGKNEFLKSKKNMYNGENLF